MTLPEAAVTLLQPQTGAIPTPHPTAVSQPYWDGAARGELLFQRCGACNGITPHAGAAVRALHVAATSRGSRARARARVYTWTTVWRPQTPEFTVPYAAVIVDMDEGWHMLSNVVGCEHDAAEVGMRVEVEFHPLKRRHHPAVLPADRLSGDMARRDPEVQVAARQAGDPRGRAAVLPRHRSGRP